MSYVYYKASENELYHHGILGMRWGVRRYQPYPSGSKKGKEIGDAAKKSRGGSFRERRAKKKMAQQQAEILQNARSVKEQNEARAKRLEEIKKRPTATAVLEFANELSTQELNELNSRISAIRQLEMTAAKERDAGFDKVDKAMGKVKKVTEWGKTGTEGYKIVNDIVKILEGTYGKDNKKKPKKEQKDNES